MKWIKSGVRFGVFLGAITSAYATTTLISVETTSTQAILRIRTDQTGSCVVKVSAVNSFGVGYAPINDVNTAYFNGSDQCSRAGNIGNGNRWTLVIGKRAAELASDGKMRYSRALQTVTRYYYSIAVGSDALTGDFTTGNIQTGNTRNDSRFDRLRPGEYAYPSIDWTSGGKATKYVDPQTGVAISRVFGPGEVFPDTVTGRTFSSTAGGAGWTGTVWSGTGTGSYLKLRASAPSPAFTVFQSVDAVRLVATLSGTSPAAEVCLTNNGVSCAGSSVTQTITTTPTAYTIGSTVPILNAWRNSPNIPSTYPDFQPTTGTVTKAGTAITWTGGGLFNLNWTAGSLITLGSTDCAIASLTHEKAMVLSSAGCTADGSYSFTGRNWGFLLRATGTGTLTVANPTWTSSTTGTVQGSASGIAKLCSPVKVMGPTGMGQVCSGAGALSQYASANPIFWVGDDGTVNLIAPSFAATGNSGLLGATCSGEGLFWDSVVPTQYWCMGSLNGTQVLYTVTYTGNYSAVSVPLDSYMASAVVDVKSTDINALVSAFTDSDPVKFSAFTSMFGWRIIANQGGKIILSDPSQGQESVAWFAVFDPATSSIVAAMSTYGGGSNTTNRWCGLHTPNIGGDTNWLFMSCNPSFPAYISNVSSGALTSSYSTCPTNTILPSLAGQAQCSQLTLASITPTNAGSSLYGQSFKIGDEAIVLSNGDPDHEIVRILTIAGTVVNVQRNSRPYQDQFNSKFNHFGTLGLYASPGAWHEIWWDFVTDPHAQSMPTAFGSTVFEDPTSSNCHEVYENAVFIEGCVKDYQGNGKIIRVGDLPASFSNNYFLVNPDATFHGSTFYEGANYLEQHPSIGQRIATDYEKPIWLDNRPYAGNPNITAPGNVTQVIGNVYKVSAAATVDLNYRLQGIVGLAGALPLVDVSPAVITNTAGDYFKFCYVLIVGDCHAGSIAGEIYFNVPQLTSTSVVISRFVNYPDLLLRDITFTQNTFTHQNVAQGKAVSGDFYGNTIRRLTTAFAPEKIQSQYWNNMALPDNSRAFWVSNHVEFARDETLLMQLPPWPISQSTNRGAFVPVAMSLSGVSGDTVRVRFGYAENGAATALYCHERQTACATDASAALPFVWTDETQHWATCNTRCTVNVPAISGRVLYYVVDRKNGSTTVSGGLEAVLVP